MSLSGPFRRLLIAFQFLTVLRVRVGGEVTPSDLRGSTYFYPFVGLALGGALALMCEALASLLPWQLLAALVVVGLAALTGGLHLDGLADTCDGFYAGRNREHVLHIMRDPRIGSMGVIGLVCVLGLKYIALLSVPGSRALWAVVAAPIVGRCAMVAACALAPYARQHGTGGAFVGQLGRGQPLVAVVMAAVGCAMLGWPHAVIAFAGVGIWLGLFVRYCRRRIGGLTGDTLGALNETTEMLVWLARSCQWPMAGHQ
ncbi:MAG: adenosylcobinamide-GDP ribazoletransferase [Verrucomicrobiae bacterium]|nr:adenosylcobinamide-GDP ribazoletransferase [Verrucomicrobiae bacterium]